MKRKKYLLAILIGLTLCSSIPVYAGQWEKSGSGWYYTQEDGQLNDGWHIIDGKWYYFNSAGLMASDEIIDGYYVGIDGAWDGKEGNAESNNEWTGSVRLITNEMYGGVMSIYNGGEDILQYNPEKQCFVAQLEHGQGADIKNVIMDIYGNIIADGYSEALWLRKDGYLRVKYCYAGTEQEADGSDIVGSDVYKIALDLMEGDTYYELYDWSGTIIDKQYMEKDGYWLSGAMKKYPPDKFTYNPVSIVCTPVEGGFILTDTQGQKEQFLSMKDSSRFQWRVVGNLLEFYDESRGCGGIYWIQ